MFNFWRAVIAVDPHGRPLATNPSGTDFSPPKGPDSDQAQPRRTYAETAPFAMFFTDSAAGPDGADRWRLVNRRLSALT